MAIGTRLTIAGAVLLAKALNGKPLNFTRGAFGDAVKNGATVVPTDDEQDNLTALIRERMTLPIKDYVIKENGDMIVTVSVRNKNVSSEFRMIEIGLFAQDPDTKQEFLYGYCYDADGGKMYAKNSAVALEYLLDLTTTVGNASKVTVTYTVEDNIRPGAGMTRTGDTLNVNVANPTLLGAVKIGEGLHMNQDSITANTASTTKLGAVKIGEGLHMNQDSITADVASTTKLGSVKIGEGVRMVEDSITAAVADETKLGSVKVGKGLYMQDDSLNAVVDSVPEIDEEKLNILNSRLTQLEINQSNLFMKLEAENDLGMTANLLLVEDFIDKDCIDQTAVPINVVVETNNYMKTSADISGLFTGADYTVVKNTSNQPLHITSLNRVVHNSLGTYYQIRPAPDESFLTGDNTIVYRSTAAIRDNTAYGPGRLRKKHRASAHVWKGVAGATTTTTVALDTSLDNASKFTITDDGMLTSDGYFTLA